MVHGNETAYYAALSQKYSSLIELVSLTLSGTTKSTRRCPRGVNALATSYQFLPEGEVTKQPSMRFRFSLMDKMDKE